MDIPFKETYSLKVALCSTEYWTSRNVVFPSRMVTTVVVEIGVASRWLEMGQSDYITSGIVRKF